MRVSKTTLGKLGAGLAVAALVACASCKKDVVEKRVYNVTYEVNPVTLYASNADKNKQKSSLQYISILYTDLFNQSIPSDRLNKMAETTLSIGDKTVASDLILQKLLVQPGVQIPTNQQMRDDVPRFVSDTYLRFFQRYPSPYEAYRLRQLIDGDAATTPEMVYAAFVLSNEYYYY